MDSSTLIEAGKWLFVAIVAPVFGWLGGAGRTWRAAKRRKKALIQELSGYPLEAKAVLVNFHHNGTHTQRGDPSFPAVALLVEKGVLKIGPGGGTYDAIDRYLSVHPKVWEVMDDWAAGDRVAHELILDMIREAAEQAEGREPIP